jgi:hypothetical protein
VGSVGHGLGTAGDNDIGVSSHDSLGTKYDGLQARGADLVDGGADSAVVQAGTEGTLSGGVLSDTNEEQISINCMKCD